MNDAEVAPATKHHTHAHAGIGRMLRWHGSDGQLQTIMVTNEHHQMWKTEGRKENKRAVVRIWARKKKRELIPPRMFRNHQCMSCKVCITGQVRSVEDEEEEMGAFGLSQLSDIPISRGTAIKGASTAQT